MKKSLLSILSLVLLLVSIPSLAAQKQIQFLDNKWGSSCPEVLKLLRKKNVYATGLGQYWDTTVESIIGYSQSDKYELVTTYSAFAFPSSGKTQGFELEGYIYIV